MLSTCGLLSTPTLTLFRVSSCFLQLQPSCELPLGLRCGPVWRGGGPVLQLLTLQIGWSVLASPGPRRATPQPQREQRANLKKLLLQKNVVLAMLYHIVFEKSKKLISKLSMLISAQFEHGTIWLEPGQFLKSNLRGLFFDLDFFFNFRCSKGVKRNDEIKSFSKLIL